MPFLHRLFAAAAVFFAASSGLSAPSAAPTVVITPAKISVTGITPGAQVLFFGAGFEPRRSDAVLHRWSSVVTDDGHGTVDYPLDPPVNWNALWIVADLRNGHYTIAATPGFPIDRERFTKGEFKRDGNADVTRFLYGRVNAEYLYLLSGGAWTFSARDGGDTDLDGAVDGATVIDLLRFKPALGADKPRAFTPGGTLFAIDTLQLDLLELKIDGSMLAGAH